MLKVINGGKAPTKGSKYSACIDLYAREDIVIGAGETVKVPLGVCIDLDMNWYMGNKVMPWGKRLNENPTYGQGAITGFEIFKESHYLKLEPRSSLRAKGLQAGTGIIDLDYEDEICIILHNPIGNHFSSVEANSCFSTNKYKIKKHDKIAQIMLCPHKTFLMGIETDEERNGGFGSTGEK